MAGQRETPLLAVSGEVANLLQPAGSADLVLNFKRTREGTLAPVLGPAPLIPDYGQGLLTYGNPHGVIHARLMEGRRDVLLYHMGTSIYVQDAPNRSQTLLVGVAGSTALLETTLVNDTAARFPTQFLVTPDYIVIMPQGGTRPLLYDGERVAYLGYNQPPGAPNAISSPLTSTDILMGSLGHLLHPDFGYGRLGTISNESGDNSLLRGGYEYAVRFKDRWDNWSPLSSRSNAVAWKKQVPATTTDPAEDLRPITMLTNIDLGPIGTEGREVARTKDKEHSGTDTLFVLPNAMGGNFTGAFATMPDNDAPALPDNAPDTWLSIPVIETDPMPAVRFGVLFDNRAWYSPANAPGTLIGTLRGRWGTPEHNLVLTPDPSGGELTGAYAFGNVMLVWTRTTTFEVSINNNGDGYRTATLHPSIGCVGPSARASLPDGSVVWLGDDDVYRYDGREDSRPVPVSTSISATVRGLNHARLRQACAAFDPESQEARFWVADAGQTENGTCLILDAAGTWRRRDGESARSVCVTQDHRRLMVVAGYVTPAGGAARSGIWILDRRDPGFAQPTRTYTIRTGFYAPPTGEKHEAKMTAFLWFREGRPVTITATTCRDYRFQVIDNSSSITPNDKALTPSTWGATLWGATGARWVRRKPVLERYDVYVPGAEAFQLQITSTSPFEWVGLTLSGVAQPAHARVERA